MEHLRDLRKKRTLLGFVCTLTVKGFLCLVDIFSIGACFVAVFCLIYLTILKDSAEVLVYTTVKYTSRIKWLCRILRVNSLLEISTADLPAASEDPTLQVVANQHTSHQIHSPISESVVCGSVRIDENPAHSSYNHLCENAGGEGSILTAAATAEACSSGSPATPNSLRNLDDTNFDDVDLTSDDACVVSPISAVQSYKKNSLLKSDTSGWSLQPSRVLNSLRKSRLPSSDSLKANCRSIASKVADVFTNQAEDKEKLVPFDGSPEQMGCCTSIPHFFKARLQLSPTGSMQYKKF